MSAGTGERLSDGGRDFIDDDRLNDLLAGPASDPARLAEAIDKAVAKQPLDLDETAVLLRADEAGVERILEAAHRLKEEVYGNRIVLFAPLYIGNECINDCRYCGFKTSNRAAVRRTLSEAEIRSQVAALERAGHKRLILVFGEHPRYDAAFIAESVRTVYGVREGRGEIRRININAAPLDVAGFATVKAAGIGTYQIFQETYHHRAYTENHPGRCRKGDYLWRLDGPARAMQAGIDDVGLGALFGLHDWRFEVLGLVAHALELQSRFGVGPHTISFPRLRPASGVAADEGRLVADHDFMRLIATLRLAVPYTGLICTAREPASVRSLVMSLGVSQIDAGSRIEIGGYTDPEGATDADRGQFSLGDVRPLDTVMRELLLAGYLPSFCTACYRLGRTGEHFMEFAIPGFIKRFCTPNGLATLQEYLSDYAGPETCAAGNALIEAELAKMTPAEAEQMRERLVRIASGGERDLIV